MVSTHALATIAFLLAPNTGHVTENPNVQRAATCFKSDERTAGANKICYYNCLGTQVPIKIGASELCPLTIEQ